jgi:putative transposase
MIDQPDPGDRDRWARLRFAIIGPLLAAPPAKGELQNTLRALSRRTWKHPTNGEPIQFGKSTLERWFYAARRTHQDPVGVLKTKVRSDAGGHRVLLSRVMHFEGRCRGFKAWLMKAAGSPPSGSASAVIKQWGR